MAFRNFGRGDAPDEWSDKIRELMDEMLNRSFVPFRRSETWQPATNVYETRDAYYVCVDLAGVPREAIEVRCDGQCRVLLRGSRQQPRPDGVDGPLSVHVLEIDEGRFEREIDLPEAIDDAGVNAAYTEGYLWITLPKRNQA